ncbi:hypothetical protein SAMN04487996_111304 [Dyadobacter soli]|uniref:Uncharacterized protein n=1 Tax=Dyadobacter soli TaxID=659014 RepID=A0A1G7MMD4_9BACT|nr:hypothetical protein [Dyadobacter soli]SDF62280.1 hypothetical protein SAMN04487996_111304 [Dyadobacter soli]
MKPEEHLTDDAIQQLALGETIVDSSISAHAGSCPSCAAQVRLYRQINLSLARIPSEAFDFELAPLVMASLSAEKSSTKTDSIFAFFIAAVGIAAAGGLLWQIHASLEIKLFAARQVLLDGVMLIGGLLFLFLAFSAWQSYARKIGKLNESKVLQQLSAGAV